MAFPISGVEINPLALVAIGFVVGLLGGFFGVGGSFLAGPALFALGVPMHMVVGTDLTHIVGKSIVASRRHYALGNVDIKLGLYMTAGTIAGVEAGAQAVQALKRHGDADFVISIAFILVLLSISAFVGWESWRTHQMQRSRGIPVGAEQADASAIDHVARRVHRFRLGPHIAFPDSGIASVSLWAVLGVAFFGGCFSGFLGGGAGYIRMPAMVYLLGVPTHVAVGTDLFEIVISAGYGTVTHALKGNVDVLIALVMHTGAAIGAQVGASLTEFFHGSRIRMAFVPLPLLGALLVMLGLATGH